MLAIPTVGTVCRCAGAVDDGRGRNGEAHVVQARLGRPDRRSLEDVGDQGKGVRLWAERRRSCASRGRRDDHHRARQWFLGLDDDVEPVPVLLTVAVAHVGIDEMSAAR